MKFTPTLLATALAATGLCLATATVRAETVKNVMAEPVVFQTLQQWGTQLGPQMASPAPILVTAPVAVPRLSWEPPTNTVFTAATLATAGTLPLYIPAPVIVGTPDLPLVGAEAGGAWGPQANYQGLQARLVVLKRDGATPVHELNSMKYKLNPGEKFKIRLAPTFNALVTLDQVIGEDWKLVRTGQVYPNPGNSVFVKASEVLDLPLEKGKYFQLESPIRERVVLNVRHEQANPQTRSEQPAYRQDARSSSNYVQLVPRGSFPAIEQLITPQSRTR